MGRALRLLIIEDVEDHALLIVRELQKGGFDPVFERVETLQELEAALELRTWDAIISDFNLTGFDGIDALRAVQEKGLDLPFLLVSGAIGEEKAAEVMRAGAHDYIRKGNYARLAATLERELLNAKIRHERRLSAEELTRHREHLEEMVQERTEELVKANEALAAEIEERKRAEEALHAATRERQQTLLKLEAVLDNIREGVVISDLEGNVVTMNKEALALQQYESVDQVRQHLSQFQERFELFDLEGRPVQYEEWPLALAIRGERFVDYEVQVRHKENGKLWIGSFNGTPVCSKEGDCILAVITVRDITARKRLEEARRKSEHKFIKIFNAAPSLMGITSLPEGKVIDVNEAALRALGYRREEVVGRTISELGLWADEADLAQVTQALEQQGSLRNLEIRFKEKSGETLVGLFSAELISLEDENYMLSLVSDITDRKRAEEALLRAKEEWERTFDSVPDLIAILDDRYRIIRVNRAMAERLGRQPDDCLGLLCYQAIHGSELAPESCPHPKTQSDAREHHAVALEAELGGQFLVTTTPLTQDGESKGTVYMARDLTERMRAEEEIARLNAKLAARVSELEERNQELEAFNRMVSHDLRQPLNTIGLACQQLELMCSNDLEEICKTTIQIAYKSTLRMNTMIETLLKFAASAQTELQRESINLCDLASEIIAEASLAEPDRKVTFTCGEAPMANGDSSLLRTVLENLIGNAWKYTGKREEGLIEFGATEIDGNNAYFVRDNGKGFNMVDADKLFIPFQRLPDAEEFKGTGIGLATVERIIRRHGGRIWAEGEPDRGATFYFTLDGPHSSSEV